MIGMGMQRVAEAGTDAGSCVRVSALVIAVDTARFGAAIDRLTAELGRPPARCGRGRPTRHVVVRWSCMAGSILVSCTACASRARSTAGGSSSPACRRRCTPRTASSLVAARSQPRWRAARRTSSSSPGGRARFARGGPVSEAARRRGVPLIVVASSSQPLSAHRPTRDEAVPRPVSRTAALRDEGACAAARGGGPLRRAALGGRRGARRAPGDHRARGPSLMTRAMGRTMLRTDGEEHARLRAPAQAPLRFRGFAERWGDMLSREATPC